MRATALPEVTDALVALGSVALAASMTVEDGRPLQPGDGDMLIVGFTGPLDFGQMYAQDEYVQPAAASRLALTAGLTEEQDEILVIPWAIVTTAGDGTRKSARDFVCARLTEVKAFLMGNPHLDGACEQAYFGPDREFYFPDSPSGYTAAVTGTFTIETYG